MTDDRPQPDYSELLRSPYEADTPEREEGQSDLPWVPAVIAAVLGALVVSAFVVISLIGGPSQDQGEAISTSTTVTAPPPEPSTALPEGFTAVTPDVGFRVEGVDVSGRATAVAVSTAVAGGLDPAEVAPPDVAYWELRSGGTESMMLTQYGERGALGNLTLEFPPVTQLRQPELVAYLAEGSEVRTSVVDLPTQVPDGTLEDYRIDMGGGRVVVIDELTIGDGWGFVTWHSEGSSPARVTTVVTFVGTDDPGTQDFIDPTILTPASVRTISQGTGSRPLPPMYGFTGSEPLFRSGEPLGGSNTMSSISVEFTVEVPERIAEPVPITFPGSG